MPTTYTTRLSTKGQIVIPAPLRRKLDLEPGQDLVLRETKAGFEVAPAERKLASPEEVQAALDRLGQTVGYTGPPVPVEQLGISGPDGIRYDDAYPDDPECRGDRD